MSLAVLYLDERGEPAIDGFAIWQNAIELVFSATPPDEIDGRTINEGLKKAHDSILSIAAKLIDRVPAAPLPVAPSDARDNVIVADFSPKASAPVLPLDETSRAEMELPLETPPQPVRLPEAKKAAARATPPAPSIARTASPAPKQKKSVQEIFNLVQDVRTVETKPEPRRRRSDIQKPAKLKLPRRLSRVEDALKMDAIICLEDGKAVPDLAKHLAGLGMTPEQYLAKWELPPTYPMKAPSLILKRGFEYEYDPVRKRMIRT